MVAAGSDVGVLVSVVTDAGGAGDGSAIGTVCVTAGVAATVGAIGGAVAVVALVSLLVLPRLSARMPPIASRSSAAPRAASTIGPLLFFLVYPSSSSSSLDCSAIDAAIGVATGADRACEGTVSAAGFLRAGVPSASGAMTTAGVLGPSFGV